MLEIEKYFFKPLNVLLNNCMNWMKEMGKIYEEGWASPLSISPNRGRAMPPDESSSSLAYKGLFGAPEDGILNKAMAMSSINPVAEQEEDSVLNIKYKKILDLIEEELVELDFESPTDRTAILALTNLKEKIRKLA